jgi:hypothetical protein
MNERIRLSDSYRRVARKVEFIRRRKALAREFGMSRKQLDRLDPTASTLKRLEKTQSLAEAGRNAFELSKARRARGR